MSVEETSGADLSTLPELLRERATHEPTRKAFVFLDDSGIETVTLTYGELYRQAVGVARHLLEHNRPGDRALLVFPQCADFIVAYLGCLYAQVIAVPIQPPRANGLRNAAMSIVRDCEPSVVLTVTSMIEPARGALDALGGPLRWLAVDELVDQGEVFAQAADTAIVAHRPTLDDIAFLQYTSGSTSDPKGVIVSHGNLVANQRMIQGAFGHDRNSTVVGWAPFFHDQGLIGNVLQPLYVGATSVLMSPSSFIRRPLGWLAAISRHRAHTSGGPNFAFDACVARATHADISELDLSCWKVAFNGAEPIRHDTLQRFTERFESVGFTADAFLPCYGLAEATLLVSAAGKGRGAHRITADVTELGRKRVAVGTDSPASNAASRTLVGSGRVLAEEDVRIVDPQTRRPCRADQIGEIWVSGDHVAQGYWRRPEQTAMTFQAELEGPPARPYLRTGDLGALIDDELFVVGRLKDMVIIRGRNYYPHDIENTAQSAHPSVRPGGCAAFSVPRHDIETLIVVLEINDDSASTSDLDEISFAIRGAITSEHQVTAGDVLLVRPGQLHKTSSGKIMRAAARRRYLNGEFDCAGPRIARSDPADLTPSEGR